MRNTENTLSIPQRNSNFVYAFLEAISRKVNLGRHERKTRKIPQFPTTKKVNGNFSFLTQMSMHQKSDFKDLFLNNHLDLQMSVLCSVEFVDIYKALYRHTQTGCSVVIDATSRKHMTVFSFGNFNGFRVVAVNGGQWIKSYLTISSCKTNGLILFRKSILRSSIQIRSSGFKIAILFFNTTAERFSIE